MSPYREPGEAGKDRKMPKKKRPPVGEGYVGIAGALGAATFIVIVTATYHAVHDGNLGALAVAIMCALPMSVSLFMLLQAQWRGYKS